MIKGDVKISEPSMNAPQIQPVKNLEANFSTEEVRRRVAAIETGGDKMDVKIRFTRLKRRMRTRSSSIF